MASDTVPAAVPGPTDPPASTGTGQQPGGLAGVLSAVDPARPAGFHLSPTTGAPAADDALPGVDQSVAGASSAAYTGLDNAEETGTGKAGSSGTSKDTGVIRAYLLAGAERWRKGGDARLKRLDIQKARAQAYKEARKVNETRTVNRAEKIVGGSTNSSTGSNSGPGKSLNSKNSTGGGGKKNSGGGRGNPSGHSGGHGPAGRGTGGGGSHKPGGSGGGHGSSGGSNGASRRTPGGSGGRGNSGTKHSPGSSGNGSSTEGGRGGNRSSGATGDGSKAPGPSGNHGKDGRQRHSSPKPTSKGSGGGGAHGNGGSDTMRKPPPKVHSPGSSSGKPWRHNPKPNTAGGPGGTPGNANTKPNSATDPKNAKTTPNPPGGADGTQPHKPGSPVTTTKPAPTSNPARATGKPLGTKEARETGYRDGSRVAKVVANAQAYKDGATDGYRDTKELAAKEKAVLDKAHDDLKKQRQTPPVPPKPNHPPKPTQPPTPAPGTQAKDNKPQPPAEDRPQPQPRRAAGEDTRRPARPDGQRPTPRTPEPQRTPDKPTTEPPATKGPTVTQAPPTDSKTSAPQPVHVKDIDGDNVYLGDNAARATISRGEVRTLCSYQRRLATKTDRLTRIAEGTRALEQHAREQAKKVTHLLEQARAKEAGHLVATLTQLQEATNVLAVRAAQLHQRAVRATEACQTLIANVDTRYAEIYQAVIDSPETAPAEMTYYMEMANAA